MKILIVGGGGREHALAWRLKQSPRVTQIMAAPGNPGIAEVADCVAVAADNVKGLVELARIERPNLVIVGPEVALVHGLADRLREIDIPVFGPSARAAMLEGSKGFSKDFMARYSIPTARYRRFNSEQAAEAKAYLETFDGPPYVLKADGLAAGKGVVIAETRAEAEAEIDAMLGGKFGNASSSMVIEEFMHGEEASFFALCDGETAVPLAGAQDHKRVGDGDTGPNTGGMGAYSPAPVVTPNVHAKVMHEIINPTIAGMAKDGIPFTGFLYAGLMIDAQGQPRTVEFNCRLGDPEAEVILMRLKSDLFEVLMRATDPSGLGLDGVELQWDRRTALGVVVAAQGYPAAPRKGDVITGVPVGTEDLQVFHAGTELADGQLRSSGGRVLCVTALGDSVRVAQQRALAAVQQLKLDGAHWRSDIGHRAIKH